MSETLADMFRLEMIHTRLAIEAEEREKPMTPEYRHNITQEGLRKLQAKLLGKVDLSPEDQVMQRAYKALEEINQHVRPMVPIFLNKTNQDWKGLGKMITSALVDQFKSWSKEDLLFLVTVINLELITDAIKEQSP